MKRLTRQELFDNAARGVLKQGRRALDANGGCLYLAGNCRCGIGHSIPDGHEGLQYKGDVEGLVGYHLDLADLFDAPINMNFLRELQRAHDYAGTVISWEGVVPDFASCFRKAMRDIAKDYKLNTDSLDEDLTSSPKSV